MLCVCQLYFLLKNKKKPNKIGLFRVVRATGLEPAASWSQTKHSTKLSYASITLFLLFFIQTALLLYTFLLKMSIKKIYFCNQLQLFFAVLFRLSSLCTIIARQKIHHNSLTALPCVNFNYNNSLKISFIIQIPRSIRTFTT